MRLATFSHQDSRDRLGAMLSGERFLDLSAVGKGEPAFGSMLDFIAGGEAAAERARDLVDEAVDGGDGLDGHILPLSEVRLRAPIPRPRKNVFCVGLNYLSHVEANAQALGIRPEVGEVPLFFTKPATAVIGGGEPILLDRRLTQKLDYEVELAIVIGKGGTWIEELRAMEHVFGFTLINDVSARDLQWRTSQMFIGKGLDSFCPMGPVIVDRAEAGERADFELVCRVNGEERQRESAANLIFPVPRLIAELSKGLTLEPGDVISTGTPGGCGYQMTPARFLAVGDVVECSADGLGRLINQVAAYPMSRSATPPGAERATAERATAERATAEQPLQET
jgi:2-keto-4-pentenoate hydratase/2-oxohepta-3-ene-1,7-dioic acid hydratase in catechol pathway